MLAHNDNPCHPVIAALCRPARLSACFCGTILSLGRYSYYIVVPLSLLPASWFHQQQWQQLVAAAGSSNAPTAAATALQAAVEAVQHRLTALPAGLNRVHRLVSGTINTGQGCGCWCLCWTAVSLVVLPASFINTCLLSATNKPRAGVVCHAAGCCSVPGWQCVAVCVTLGPCSAVQAATWLQHTLRCVLGVLVCASLGFREAERGKVRVWEVQFSGLRVVGRPML